MATKKSVKEVKEEKKEDELKFTLIFPDGTISEGSTTLREFTPNIGKGFKNSGFQTKISNGHYSGSLMVIDYLKQVKI
jgi:hypothetical protein